MTPRRPYMLRAFYDWLVDNDLTPHLVVAAELPGVRVPLEFVQDGQIILNIAPRAVGNLELGNEAITFNARFSGRPHSVIVPLYAVQASTHVKTAQVRCLSLKRLTWLSSRKKALKRSLTSLNHCQLRQRWSQNQKPQMRQWVMTSRQDLKVDRVLESLNNKKSSA